MRRTEEPVRRLLLLGMMVIEQGSGGWGGATNSGYLRVNPGRESRRVIAVSRFKS